MKNETYYSYGFTSHYPGLSAVITFAYQFSNRKYKECLT